MPSDSGDILKTYDEALIESLRNLPLDTVRRIGDLIFDAWKGKRRIFVFGNGGSSATASHFATDLNKGALAAGKKLRFKALCLSDSTPALTAWANDTSYNNVFREQMANFLEAGDIAIAISASGNSQNIIDAIEFANAQGAVTIGLCGFDGGRLGKIASCALVIQNDNMEQVEDVHAAVCHMLKVYLIRKLRDRGETV